MFNLIFWVLFQDKMDLKKSITEFRQFQRDRRNNILLNRKMLKFDNVCYQRGAKQINGVLVRIRMSLGPDLGVITMCAEDFQGNVELTDLATFNDQTENITEVVLIFEKQEGIKLRFDTVTQKGEVVAYLKKCLRMSNRSTPDPGLPH
ncbi:uncharacterized protein LOC135125570 [Zophobas morio]|uniref:uncharacterized protein LOC135125570 n=1 Tax=Zophobas morio TaxID=2755281 RepID=UPI0030837B6E